MLGEGTSTQTHANHNTPDQPPELAEPSGLRGQLPRSRNGDGVIAMHPGKCPRARKHATNHKYRSNAYYIANSRETLKANPRPSK